MIVTKFGGTSVSSKERILTICDVVRREQARQPIVVISAIRGVTDLLLSLENASHTKIKKTLEEIENIHCKLSHALFDNHIPQNLRNSLHRSLREIGHIALKKKKSKEVLDRLVSYGEILSSYIVAQVLQKENVNAQYVNAMELIVTDSNFGCAEFLPNETIKMTKNSLAPLLKAGIIPIVTGFIGATQNGKTTTLGRGGSDYSAAIIGYALGASEIQIWTDVDGIYTADPRLVRTALLLPRVTYREASELATFGARILHPRTIRPAVTENIPVRVLNTLNPQNTGTLIEAPNQKIQRVTAIASKQRITLVNLYSANMLLSRGFLERIFAVFANHNISVDLVSVSEVSISVTLDNDENLKAAVSELQLFTTVTVKEMGMVSIIGEGIAGVNQIMQNIFSVLDNAQIRVHMISFGASAINISVVIDTEDVATVVRLLHDSVLVRTVSQERSYL